MRSQLFRLLLFAVIGAVTVAIYATWPTKGWVIGLGAVAGTLWILSSNPSRISVERDHG
jgi:1,4-dihydroxy-2-naphthoate octaprenyltransferase